MGTTGQAMVFLTVVAVGMLIILSAFAVAELRREVKELRDDHAALRHRHFLLLESTSNALRELGCVWEPGAEGRWRKL